MKIELIVWRDAGSLEEDSSWMHAEDIEGDTNPMITSVGYVVKETANNLTIAQDMCDDGQSHGRSRIPIGMIVSREVIYGQGEDK